MSTSFFTELRVNPAIMGTGVYRAGNAEVGQFPGNTRSFASGEWLIWYLKLETPWGAVSYGKRPFGFGLGLQYDASNRTEEYLAVVTDYGPLQFGLGVYPSRQGIELSQGRDFSGNPITTYGNPSDKSGRPSVDLFGFVNYEQGPVEAGLGTMYFRQHVGPEGTVFGGSRPFVPPLDLSVSEGWVFVRYNNNRFFFHAEADWYCRTARFGSSATGFFALPDGSVLTENTDGSGSIFRTQHTESWRWMTEVGVIAGPMRTSLLYAVVPGPDRRHGVLIDRQPVIVNAFLPNFDQVVYNQDLGNAGVFRSYSTLLCSAYGSGVGAVTRGGSVVFPSGEGYIVDASILAGRVDYALASNFNIWASVLKAWRPSHGYGWGYIRPSLYDNKFQVWYGLAPTLAVPSLARNFTAPIPAIPDNDLGWEVNAGLDWQLLEGWNINISAAYWRPGRWFNYACIDRSVPGWDDPGPGNLWGTNPDREIDPIFGLSMNISLGF